MTGNNHNVAGSFLPTEDGEFNGNIPDEMSSLPQILEIKPGDRFVIKLDVRASGEIIERVQATWRSFAGDDAKLLVLDKGVELSVLRGKPTPGGGVSRSDLLQRMSSALDDLSPDDTIGFSNGAQWIDVATVAEVRNAAYPSPAPSLEARWFPIDEADRTINHVTEFTQIGLTLKNSDTFWVRDEDGRVYRAAWSEGNNGRDYWWDWEAESPVDPVEFMPHPLDPRFSTTEASDV